MSAVPQTQADQYLSWSKIFEGLIEMSIEEVTESYVL